MKRLAIIGCAVCLLCCFTGCRKEDTPGSSAGVVALSSATVSTTATTVFTTATTQTATTAARTTRRNTTRRTVPPPPIVVEPDHVKDDVAERPDDSKKPASPNGVTLQMVRNEFGGAGNLIGIDVSRHQGSIDWPKVKAAGVTFAIIRCGYRTTVGGQVYEDANFRTNIEGALAAGVQVGVYFFSAAKNETEALEEAAFVIKVLESYRDRVTWPVVYDFEIFDQDRLQGVSDTTVSNNAIAFLDTVADAGYTPMLYSSRNMLWREFETARLGAYRVWMAHYVNKLSEKKYNGDHAMWQCASDGRVDGIQGDVDLNIAYTDLSRVPPYLPAPAPDTFPTQFAEFSFAPVCEEVQAGRELSLRISPYEDRPNKWITLPQGTRILRTGIDRGKGWSRVEVSGVTLYVKSDAVTFLRATATTAKPTTTVAPTTTTTTVTAPATDMTTGATAADTTAHAPDTTTIP